MGLEPRGVAAHAVAASSPSTSEIFAIATSDAGRFSSLTGFDFRRARAIFTKLEPNSLEASRMLANLGVVQRKRGDLEQATGAEPE